MRQASCVHLPCWTSVRMPCLSAPDVSKPAPAVPHAERVLTRAGHLRKRLGGTGDAFSFGSKPKGMHRRTYERLVEEIENLTRVLRRASCTVQISRIRK